MDRPSLYGLTIADQHHLGGALFGNPDVPMDLLSLNEVAELLGEPESVILAACRSFPEHVPVAGSGRTRRFPSIALDVLRLITDATAAGVPAPAIVHLIETHFAAARARADQALETSGLSSTLYADESVPFDMDELAGRIEASVEQGLLSAAETLASVTGSTQAAVDQIREELRSVARADDLRLLATELRQAMAANTAAAFPHDLTAEFDGIRSSLRPAVHGLEEIKLAVEGIREEMAALRWQLDQREQLGRIVAELAEIRSQVERLETGSRTSESVPRSADPVTTEAPEVDSLVDHPSDAGAVGDEADSEVAPPPSPAASQTETDAPSAIITEFASRTPRRMGRTLFADEG